MCHWVLRVWKCGDSFFTKYSSCSVDRAAHGPANPLNPLHPSIMPSVMAPLPALTETPSSPMENKTDKRSNSKRTFKSRRNDNNLGAATNHITTNKPPQSVPPTLTPPSGPDCALDPGAYARDAKTGETIPVLLSEVGKASRFGDKTLEKNGKCEVFEVVLQFQERTPCPACVRSPRRARLPAHARGCFAQS